MPRLARPACHARDRAATLADATSQWLIGPVRRRKKALVLADAALALASAGSAAAATIPGAPAAGTAQHALLTPDLRAAAAQQAPQRSASSSPADPPSRSQAVPVTWKQVRDAINWQTNPAAARRRRLPLADRLMPVGTSGPQAWMPISGSQLAAPPRLSSRHWPGMWASGQRSLRSPPGWGTAQQIMNPAFAADAFLSGLQQYQAGNPGWAAQPLWASAQGVQKSGFPFAYARWEAQAATLVKQIAISQQQAAQATRPPA
ncbi:MAG: hypothetical protein ACRDOK_25445 [Streptosporangiaceae bacterium]